jgi:hypothetical protein
MSHLLLLLAIIPLSCFNLATTFKSKHRWLFTGISLGIVIAPVSLALIKFAYVPVIGKLISVIGLITNLIHGSVGYFILMTIGVMEPGGVLSGPNLILINIVNALIWSTYYGMLGYNIDNQKSVATSNLKQLRPHRISETKTAA